MAGSGVQTSEIILVLCHSFFHDAFRQHKPLNEDVYKSWRSSLFIANLIIERQAELSEVPSFATTSKQAFDSFFAKFFGDKPSIKQRETVDILRNSIYVVTQSSINNLSLDDGLFVICDIIYSRSNSTPILISNVPAKREKAEAFYHKKDPNANIPYPILNSIYAESILRETFPDLSKLVDERIKIGEQRK